MNTITINKLLSYDDTMTLIRNACVGLDITLAEHDKEEIERYVRNFFECIEKHNESGRLSVRLSVSFQKGQGLCISMSHNYRLEGSYATTNYDASGGGRYDFCMKKHQGIFEESVTYVDFY